MRMCQTMSFGSHAVAPKQTWQRFCVRAWGRGVSTCWVAMAGGGRTGFYEFIFLPRRPDALKQFAWVVSFSSTAELN